MPNTYFDSDLTGEQIEAALTAIDGVVTQENNGKLLAIEAGKIVAKSASEWTDTPVLEPLNVTANGDYTPGTGVDGYNSVHVSVQGGGGGSNIENASVFRWQFQTYTTCWGIMKKLTGDVIGQNGDNANADITLVGDLMTVTFHGTSQAVEVVASTAIKLKAYTTGRTLGPATMTEYTMVANDQQNFAPDALYGGLYLEAEFA